jgi:hypothetical protein
MASRSSASTSVPPAGRADHGRNPLPPRATAVPRWRLGVVLCLDVLEHVPAADRAGFAHELARVAAERVLLACPSSQAQAIDDLLVTI